MRSRKPASRSSSSGPPAPRDRTAGASAGAAVPRVEVRQFPDAVEFALHVRPRSRRSEVGGTQGQALAVRVRVPAAEGQANRAVCRILADALGVPASSVRLVTGLRSRYKRVRIEGPAHKLAVRVEELSAAGND